MLFASASFGSGSLLGNIVGNGADQTPDKRDNLGHVRDKIFLITSIPWVALEDCLYICDRHSNLRGQRYNMHCSGYLVATSFPASFIFVNPDPFCAQEASNYLLTTGGATSLPYGTIVGLNTR
jgi:hypothetical protein